MSSNPVVIVLGTRPEIVKLAPVIRALPTDPVVVHTGQHYDPNMAGVFFESFGLDEPTHRLEVGGKSRGQQIGHTVIGLDRLFDDLNPRAVMAQGDTNSTMAAAIAANSRSIPMVHVESGLRSYDRNMPEEHNRVVADHLSDLCLAPTETSRENLAREGIDDQRVRVTGNTVVDAVRHLLPDPERRAETLKALGLRSGEFVLSTFHRPENVDHPANLRTILDELSRLSLPVFLPIHPRTRAMAEVYGIDLARPTVTITEPMGYIEFLSLLAECRLAVADSGGLQEEVSVLKRPMVVVRNSTERPEVLGTFGTLVGVSGPIYETARRWLEDDPFSIAELAAIPSPYGNGDAGRRSVAELERFLDSLQ